MEVVEEVSVTVGNSVVRRLRSTHCHTNTREHFYRGERIFDEAYYEDNPRYGTQ
jgi:hypothetical protein